MPARDTIGLRIHGIDKDSVAEQCGQLHLTDCIIDVNGERVDDLHFDRYKILFSYTLCFRFFALFAAKWYLTTRNKKVVIFSFGAAAIVSLSIFLIDLSLSICRGDLSAS